MGGGGNCQAGTPCRGVPAILIPNSKSAGQGPASAAEESLVEDLQLDVPLSMAA